MSGAAAALTTVGLVLLAVALGGASARVLPRRSPPRRRAAATGLPLVAAGLLLRVLAELVHLPGGVLVVVASYGLLIGACLLNLARPGVPLVALGLLVMLAPTVVDGGMPVRPSALRAMDLSIGSPALPGERHVEVARDQVPLLGEVLPLPLGGRPTSFGELIALVGLADVAFNTDWRRGRRRRRASPFAGRPDPALVLDEPLPDEDEAPTVVILGPAPSPGVSGHRAEVRATSDRGASNGRNPNGRTSNGRNPTGRSSGGRDTNGRTGNGRSATARTAAALTTNGERAPGGDESVRDGFGGGRRDRSRPVGAGAPAHRPGGQP